jgi:hypothetical protein
LELGLGEHSRVAEMPQLGQVVRDRRRCRCRGRRAAVIAGDDGVLDGLRSCSNCGCWVLKKVTEFSSVNASRFWRPNWERRSEPPNTVSWMNPRVAIPAGFHCTGLMLRTGITFDPLPAVSRAVTPLRWMVTAWPSKHDPAVCPPSPRPRASSEGPCHYGGAAIK